MTEDTRQISASAMLSPVRLAYGLIPLVTLLRRNGVDPTEVLEAGDIPPFGLVDPAYTITLERELAVYRAGLKRLDVPALSLRVAELYHLRSFSVLGLAMQSCRTPIEMMTMIFTYPRLAWGMFNSQMVISGSYTRTRFEAQPMLGPLNSFMAERDIACSLVLIDDALEKPMQFHEVHFAHHAPDDITPYEDFFRCPVLFDQPHYQTIAPLEQMQQALPRADTMARAFFEAQCVRMSASMDVPFRYANAVQERLSRTTPVPDLETMATSLAMTPRTLQRRLSDEGEKFSSLLRTVREARAETMLLETNVSLDQIAHDLGFSDAVAFSHAFKSWKGVAPRPWRKQNSAQTKYT